MVFSSSFIIVEDHVKIHQQIQLFFFILRSGTEEDFNEKVQLLGEVSELLREGEARSASEAKKKADIEGKAKEMRKKAMEGIKRPNPGNSEIFEKNIVLK